MLDHFQRLLEEMVSDPQRRIGHLPLLSEAERHQLLIEWNNTGREYPKDKCIHQLFEEQVLRTPQAVALIYEDQELTYRQLNARTNQLARHLRSLGVGPGDTRGDLRAAFPGNDYRHHGHPEGRRRIRPRWIQPIPRSAWRSCSMTVRPACSSRNRP